MKEINNTLDKCLELFTPTVKVEANKTDSGIIDCILTFPLPEHINVKITRDMINCSDEQWDEVTKCIENKNKEFYESLIGR